MLQAAADSPIEDPSVVSIAADMIRARSGMNRTDGIMPIIAEGIRARMRGENGDMESNDVKEIPFFPSG